MKAFIDCEFNGFGGQLISLAIVADDGREYYEAIDYSKISDEGTVADISGIRYDPWVEQNVLPVIQKEPVHPRVFQRNLQIFLSNYETIHIISDWPDDIKYFCISLITGPGTAMLTPTVMTMEVNRLLSSQKSKLPHNSLEDARAIREHYYEINGLSSR